MENLGEFLRKQREDRNLPIEELAFRTRIGVRFIKAIEKNQFDQLPNPVSAKGFLRSYARCLGLDESAVLKQFSETVQTAERAHSGETEEEMPSYIQLKRPDRLPFPSWAALSVGGVILLLLALAFMMQREDLESTFTPSPPREAPTEDAPTDLPTVASDLPPMTSEFQSDGETLPPNQTPSTPDPSSVSPSEEILKPRILLVEAIEPAWVQVTIDGAETKEALLQPNEKVRWEAKEKFFLTVGNAGGVRVILDGQEIGPLGPSGKVVRKEIPQ